MNHEPKKWGNTRDRQEEGVDGVVTARDEKVTNEGRRDAGERKTQAPGAEAGLPLLGRRDRELFETVSSRPKSCQADSVRQITLRQLRGHANR